jgi:bifunctional polynucleotide phosphatase/kinase
LNLKPAEYTLPGFNIASLPQDCKPYARAHIRKLLIPFLHALVPHIVPSSTPLLPSPNSPAELVLFVGYPAMGKSTFYKKHFQPAGYIHVNQDTLGTRDKCLKAVEETIKAGQSCVVGELHF